MPELRERPLHVCDCGQVNEAAADRIAALERQVCVLQEDIGNAERELRGYRAKNKRLRKEQDLALQAELVRNPAAGRVLVYWKATCAPGAREIKKGPRARNVLDRLDGGYTEEQLCRSVDGYALKPFVVNGRRTHDGPKDSWRADAELIFRDPQHVDQGIRIAETADSMREAMVSENGDSSVVEVSVGRSAPKALSAFASAALRAAEHGWPVFPCREADKTPATAQGLKRAQRDRDNIVAWWSDHPEHNVAVRTGAESGVVVLDVDGDEGFDALHHLEDLHGQLPETLSVATPRGGHHFYFRHPGIEVRNTTGHPAEHLDFRGDGGYVLIPPSVGPNGKPYVKDDEDAPAPMPGWLLEALVSKQSAEDRKLGGGKDWAAFVQAGSDRGERNTRMTSYVGHLFSHGHQAKEVYQLAKLVNLRVRPPLTDRDLVRIVRSIAGRQR